MRNGEIKAKAKAARVYLWEIAEKLGITDNEFSRRLRYELPQDEQERIFRIIEELKAEQEAGE